MNKKLSGTYFTPIKIVNFAYNYLRQQNKDFSTVLEPCIGDGRFVDQLNRSARRVVGVEIDSAKIAELKNKNYEESVHIIHQDFLIYSKMCNERFSLIIGNPPYINKKNIRNEQLELCRTICKELLLPESIMKNMWVAFVLSSINLLEENGTLLFVLPTEFLQVQYAEKLRNYLEEKFNTIHIITFEEKMFPDIEQDACLVYLTNERDAPSFISYLTYYKLDSQTYNYKSKIERNKPLKKWSNAILTDDEIDILSIASSKYAKMGEIVESAPGIVTASNEYFILTKEEVSKYDCRDFVLPIISKSSMIKNKFEINGYAVNELANNAKKTYLLNLANTEKNNLPESLLDYLEKVAVIKRSNIEIQHSFKCSRRKPWYAVPIVRSGGVVFFKRYDVIPRLSINPAHIHTTDIAYNLRLPKHISPESLVFSFYNSLTLAQCEFAGRFYAGGVSELTPSEFKSLAIPYTEIDHNDTCELRKMLNNNARLDVITSFVNKRTLANDFEEHEVQQIERIHKKLIARRKRTPPPAP